MFGETDKVKQARDSAPATLVWRRAAPPLVYDKRISKCQIAILGSTTMVKSYINEV